MTQSPAAERALAATQAPEVPAAPRAIDTDSTLPDSIWLNDNGTSQSTSFAPRPGAYEHHEYRCVLAPAVPTTDARMDDILKLAGRFIDAPKMPAYGFTEEGMRAFLAALTQAAGTGGKS